MNYQQLDKTDHMSLPQVIVEHGPRSSAFAAIVVITSVCGIDGSPSTDPEAESCVLSS